jgi:mannose-6-phosphate isomerase-like protein (cupin superfamily)
MQADDRAEYEADKVQTIFTGVLGNAARAETLLEQARALLRRGSGGISAMNAWQRQSDSAERRAERLLSGGTPQSVIKDIEKSVDPDELFATGAGQATRRPAPSPRGDRQVPGPPATTDATGPVQPAATRKAIDLDSGVRWERLTADRDPEVDFLHVVYDVGGASSRDRIFMRHAGREYGLVLAGRLRVTTGFQPHELGPGDSISFDSSIPHLLENVGDEPVTAGWVVVGRHGDPRTAGFEAKQLPPERADTPEER